MLNAAAGDRLGPGLEPLAIRMAVRAGGRDVGLTADGVAAAFPCATPRLAVFVHGLAETDDSWRRRAGDSAPYGDRLQAELGYTPVYVRYNTGRHVSDSGHDLADLLGTLEAAWPEPVEEILLAGHSMGGLVIRSACHYGRDASAGWVERVRHIFYLGSPHMGAPLAPAAGVAGWVLSKVPETRPFAALGTGPSSVRDLRHGYVLDDDWPAAAPAAACAITGARRRCWPTRTTTRSARQLPPIPPARSAPCSATCSSSRPARTGGAVLASTSRSPSNSAAGSAGCTTSICSTIPTSGRPSAASSARRSSGEDFTIRMPAAGAGTGARARARSVRC